MCGSRAEKIYERHIRQWEKSDEKVDQYRALEMKALSSDKNVL